MESPKSLDTSLSSYEICDQERTRKQPHHFMPNCNHYNKKKGCKCSERNSKSKQKDKYAENHITQKIHVQKQNFQCVINLKTTVCNHSSKHKKKHDKSKYSKTSGYKETFEINNNYIHRSKHSILPKCFRESCNSCFRRKHNTMKRANRRKEADLVLSRDPLKDLSYENISSSTLDIEDSYKSTSPKHQKLYKHRKHHKHCSHYNKKKHLNLKERHESKIDTLIKRTKERERKLLEESRRIQMACSTPIPNRKPDEKDPHSSNMDISLESRSTLVLNSHFLYSPSDPPEYHNIETEDIYRSYSLNPSSVNEDYLANFPENSYKIIKSEPMDIEAYSPTHRPDIFEQDLTNKGSVKIKKEIIKSEPLSTNTDIKYFNRMGETFANLPKSTYAKIKIERMGDIEAYLSTQTQENYVQIFKTNKECDKRVSLKLEPISPKRDISFK